MSSSEFDHHVFNKSRLVIKKVLAKPQGEGEGANVRRGIGRMELKYLDPFLMLDEFSVTPPDGFPDHPHRGFETVTYMLEGSLSHQDFTGHRGTIKTGDVQKMVDILTGDKEEGEAETMVIVKMVGIITGDKEVGETETMATMVFVEGKLASVDAHIAGLNASLASERGDKKALGERLATLEADVANLRHKETKWTEDKKALEAKVSELASKLEKCCGSAANKYPWMTGTVLPGYYVPFEDLDVLPEFASKSTLITITEAPAGLGKDGTTNVGTNHFKRGMLNRKLVCVVVNVAGLLPNNELARFDPSVWGLFNKSGTSYAARKATSSDM